MHPRCGLREASAFPVFRLRRRRQRQWRPRAMQAQTIGLTSAPMLNERTFPARSATLAPAPRRRPASASYSRSILSRRPRRSSARRRPSPLPISSASPRAPTLAAADLADDGRRFLVGPALQGLCQGHDAAGCAEDAALARLDPPDQHPECGAASARGQQERGAQPLGRAGDDRMVCTGRHDQGTYNAGRGPRGTEAARVPRPDRRLVPGHAIPPWAAAKNRRILHAVCTRPPDAPWRLVRWPAPAAACRHPDPRSATGIRTARMRRRLARLRAAAVPHAPCTAIAFRAAPLADMAAALGAGPGPAASLPARPPARPPALRSVTRLRCCRPRPWPPRAVRCTALASRTSRGGRAASLFAQLPRAERGCGRSNFMRSTRSLMFFTPSHFLT